MPTTQTQRERLEVPFLVFFNHELSLEASGNLATMLKRRQKSSPFSPRAGRRVSSVLPRMIGRGEGDVKVTPAELDFGGRAKAGVMGVIGG